MTPTLPDISSMKLSEIKSELSLYGIDSSVLLEKSEFTAALQNARDTLPRPSTSYKEIEKEDTAAAVAAEPKKKSSSSSSSSKKSSSAPRSSSSNSSAPKPASAPVAAPAATPSTNTSSSSTDIHMKKLLAQRSSLTAQQQLREHPSERIIGSRSSSFLPGSPFSFSLRGSIFEADSAILRIPDGVCLIINAACVDRREMDDFLKQKGSIGISLKLSTEENPTLLPVWTFDRERSKSYHVSNLGIRVAGPRTVRLMAAMEMGFRSGASVDLNVFGSVRLDGDKF
jgi:hypothetical protein